jgi:acetyl esterase/lipase
MPSPIEPPSLSAPLLSDVGPAPPKRFHGRSLAILLATSVAASPTALLLYAQHLYRGSGGAMMGTIAPLCLLLLALALLLKLGTWLLSALPNCKWHDGLPMGTNIRLCALLNLGPMPDFTKLSIDEIVSRRDRFLAVARRMYARLVPKGMHIEDVFVPDDAQAIQVPKEILPPFARDSPTLRFRVYRRGASESTPAVNWPPLPCLVFAHGGAFVFGGADTHEHITSRLAEWADCVVISVEYRMYPEIGVLETHKAVCDVFGVLRHVVANAAELGVDPTRIGVGGDSAGGNLAAACALLARDCDIDLRFQLLVYPYVAASRGVLCSESALRNAEAPVLPLRALCELGRLGHEGKLLVDDVSSFERFGVSPIDAERGHAGCAPAIVISAYYDVLFDHAEEYCRTLRAAGVPVYYKCYYMMHGFWGGVTSREGEISLRETAHVMRELFAASATSSRAAAQNLDEPESQSRPNPKDKHA